MLRLCPGATTSGRRVAVEDASGNKLGTGTGFFVSSDGRIVTNHHVIEGAASVTATLANGSKMERGARRRG